MLTPPRTEPALPTAADLVRELYTSDPAARGLGITIELVEPGLVSIRMRVTPAMCNGHGISHGGYIFALADTAAAYALCAGGGAGVSTHATIDFLASARSGQVLTATAEERYRDGRAGIYDVAVESEDGRLVAEFRMHGTRPRSSLSGLPASATPQPRQPPRSTPTCAARWHTSRSTTLRSTA